jgi:hypothetical protein
MITQWYSHLKDEDEIKRFKLTISNSKTAFDRLKDLIEDREKAINSIETGVEIYTKAGWDALLAHYNGEKASLKYVKRLIDLDQQRETQ